MAGPLASAGVMKKLKEMSNADLACWLKEAGVHQSVIDKVDVLSRSGTEAPGLHHAAPGLHHATDLGIASTVATCLHGVCMMQARDFSGLHGVCMGFACTCKPDASPRSRPCTPVRRSMRHSKMNMVTCLVRPHFSIATNRRYEHAAAAAAAAAAATRGS